MTLQDIKLEVVAKTDTGRVRTANEDNFIATGNSSQPDWFVPKGDYVNSAAGTVLVVSDGMGGLNAGEVASRIAIDSIKEYLASEALQGKNDREIRELLESSIVTAHAEIVKHSFAYPDTEGMGCTAVVAVIKDDKVHISWAGDSRCYLMRNKKLVQLSKDHSFVQTLVDESKITKEQAFYHPESNIITQSLGGSERKPQPDYEVCALQDGDIIMLCSDGLSGMLQDDAMQNILSGCQNLSLCADVLIDQANKAGGNDNITVMLAKVIAGAGEAVSGITSDKPTGKSSATEPEANATLTTKKKSSKAIFAIVASILLLGILAWFAVPRFKSAQVQDTLPKPGDTLHKDTTVITDRSGRNNTTAKPDTAGKTSVPETGAQKPAPHKTEAAEKTDILEELKKGQKESQKGHSHHSATDSLTQLPDLPKNPEKENNPEKEEKPETPRTDSTVYNIKIIN